MARIKHWFCLFVLSFALSGCYAPEQSRADQLPAVMAQVAPIAEETQNIDLTAKVSEIVTPVSISVQEAFQPLAPPTPEALPTDDFQVLVTGLIVRWEVTSPSVYQRRYQGVIWPGGASGLTWGVGYDGGHQTPTRITSDWIEHESVDRLALGAGITGTRAKGMLPQYRDVITPYSYAEQVFTASTLPSYTAATSRAFGPGFRDLSAGARAALVSLVYNRGSQMIGKRRFEMRNIRDVCVPDKDVECIARELRAMCHLWNGTPNGVGLCSRRKDEARVSLIRP